MPTFTSATPKSDRPANVCVVLIRIHFSSRPRRDKGERHRDRKRKRAFPIGRLQAEKGRREAAIEDDRPHHRGKDDDDERTDREIDRERNHELWQQAQKQRIKGQNCQGRHDDAADRVLVAGEFGLLLQAAQAVGDREPQIGCQLPPEFGDDSRAKLSQFGR